MSDYRIKEVDVDKVAEALLQGHGYKKCSSSSCNYRGKMKKKARGSFILFLLLLGLGVFPGLIYYRTPDGRHVISAAMDSTVRQWKAFSNPECRVVNADEREAL